VKEKEVVERSSRLGSASTPAMGRRSRRDGRTRKEVDGPDVATRRPTRAPPTKRASGGAALPGGTPPRGAPDRRRRFGRRDHPFPENGPSGSI